MKVIKGNIELDEATVQYLRHMIAGQLKNLRGAPKLKRQNPEKAEYYDNIIERDAKSITDLFLDLKNEFDNE